MSSAERISEAAYWASWVDVMSAFNLKSNVVTALAIRALSGEVPSAVCALGAAQERGKLLAAGSPLWPTRQDAAKGAKWKGQNLLGQALMMARRAIEAGEEIPPPVFATAAAAAADEKKDEAGATAGASVGDASGVGGEQPDGDADEPMPEVKKQRSR